MKGKEPAVGIDLGTTYSCAAVWKHNRIEIIPNDQGNRTTPSSVAFIDGQRLIGDAAKNQATMNPANTIYDAKRLIGRSFSDSEVQEDMKFWPFKVTEGLANTPKFVVSYKGQKMEFLAEEISSMILGKMKESAEAYLGKSVNNVVITVPAYFNDSQRQATKDAGTIAGLNVIRMINEPTAAAVAYGLDNKADIRGKINVLVFDLGGGTFDVSLMTIKKGGKFEVKAVDGDTHLGGEDFDKHMVDHCVRVFKQKYSKDLTVNQKALARLRCACEKAKRVLSCTTQTTIELDCLHDGIDFSTVFTRAKFEDLNMSLFEKCITTLDKCLSDANMNKSQVDKIILVGGSTRIPKVQQMLQEFFNGKELCKTVNPDEAVAYGAAAMAAKVSGNSNNKNIKDLILSDVTPLSLGIEELGDELYIMIPRNTSIPASITTSMGTVFDNQPKAHIRVYQGERARCSDNLFLGDMEVLDIPLAPKGESEVMISFEIDVNGILTVTAETVATGKIKKLTVTNTNGRLSKDEIDKMVKEAQEYKFQDQEFKKKVAAYNDLENFLYKIEKKIEEYKLKNKVGHKNFEIKKAIAETTKWVEDNQAAPLAELQVMKKVLEFVYKPLISSRYCWLTRGISKF